MNMARPVLPVETVIYCFVIIFHNFFYIFFIILPDGIVVVESVENHGTGFKQTFRAFILSMNVGWLRDFTLRAKG